ncbi:MAG: DUF3305 domain-containing protein [Hyphomicrobiales bacterium]
MSTDAFENVDDIITKREMKIPLGIIIEKRKSKHPWGDWIWKPVEVIPGAALIDDWVTLQEGEDWTHYHIATLQLVLHRKETEAFKMNLENEAPHLYVVLRENDDPTGRPIEAHMVTASPYDAQDYLDTSEDIIEKVPMPSAIFEWIKAFVQEHHKEEVFIKRRRDKLDIDEHKFGKSPIFATTTRH